MSVLVASNSFIMNIYVDEPPLSRLVYIRSAHVVAHWKGEYSLMHRSSVIFEQIKKSYMVFGSFVTSGSSPGHKAYLHVYKRISSQNKVRTGKVFDVGIAVPQYFIHIFVNSISIGD